MTHTFGPWFIQDQKRKDFIPIGPRIRSEDYIVAGVVCLEKDNQKLDINISDARLIAAAPELLEAVKNMLACFVITMNLDENDKDAEGYKYRAVKNARDAIVKATGER
jgi:hypothetical protein